MSDVSAVRPVRKIHEVREVRSTCCYCGVGCGVLIETDGHSVLGVRGDPEHPANYGKLCSKGSNLHLTARSVTGRALYPELRHERGGARERVSWELALDHLADRFAHIIKEHGPDAVAFYISGQLLTEDYAVFNKLAKGLIGTNNVDTNSRLCMSSAVAGYKQSLGADAPPCSYEDIDSADCIFIAGSNTAFAHPVLYRRIEAARERRPEMRVIVVDPRRTDTAREASLHLPILPGTDVALFNGMLHILLWEGLVDTAYIEAHTEGYDAVKALVRDYPPKFVADLCGVAEADLVRAAKWFGESKATLSLYCQGLNQSSSGTAKNTALINLHLATAQIGRPGTGPFSLTGQPNAMGGREVGGLANLLPGHRDVVNAEHRAEVARLWGIEGLPAVPGKTAVEMFDAIGAGTIKAVWIACTNPAQSMPDVATVQAALGRAELVVVQEAYRNTETARFADVLLPAASWAEKEGTVTNSERRITRLRAAIAAPGEARADWRIACDFARRLETRLRPDRPSLFPYDSVRAVWNEHRESTRGRDLDITGLSYASLDVHGPQQWPLPEGAPTGKVRLYEDGRFPTANGRARFVATAYRPVAERSDARYPFALTTGRLRDQWHGMSRTGTLARAYSHAPEPTVVLSALDGARRGISDGDLVQVESRRGSVMLAAALSDDLRSGQAFIAMHWGERFLSGAHSSGVNTLTVPAFDPISKQPELKHTAVRIAKAELPWRLTAFGTPAEGSALDLLDALAPVMKRFPAASAVLIGIDTEAVLLRVAALQAPTADEIDTIDGLFGLDATRVIRYEDVRKAVGRRIDVHEGKLRAVRLSGELLSVAAEPWLRDWLMRGEPVEAIRRLLLVPTATPPTGFAPRGNIVCSCWNVAATEIDPVLAQSTGAPEIRLQALQAKLKCGTNCGSCVPELKAMIARQLMAPVLALP